MVGSWELNLLRQKHYRGREGEGRREKGEGRREKGERRELRVESWGTFRSSRAGRARIRRRPRRLFVLGPRRCPDCCAPQSGRDRAGELRDTGRWLQRFCLAWRGRSQADLGRPGRSVRDGGRGGDVPPRRPGDFDGRGGGHGSNGAYAANRGGRWIVLAASAGRPGNGPWRRQVCPFGRAYWRGCYGRPHNRAWRRGPS